MTVKTSDSIFKFRTAKRSGFFIALLALFSLCPTYAINTKGEFDQRLKKQVRTFGPSPYLGGYQKTLSCFFYGIVLVKQYDEGQKGAEWLSFVPIQAEHPKRCDLSHDADERVVEPNEWSGYFWGVKGNLVFFSAADGTDGGMPFAIYDSKTRKKIFKDSAYRSSMWSVKPSDSPFNNLRVFSADRQITLKYLRVVGTDCDLHSEGETCWEQVRANLQLKQTRMPVCTGYKNISTRYSSSLAYPVETVLLPAPVTKTTDGPLRCWPVD